MKGPPCVVCGSKKYRQDLGILVCSNGHQSTTFREEMGDDEAAAHMTSRAIRPRKGLKRTVLFQDTAAGGGSSTGEEDMLLDLSNQQQNKYSLPRILRYELFQQHLKHCVQTLINRKYVPTELSGIVKQLWFMVVKKTSNLKIVSHENPENEDEEGDINEYSHETLSPERLADHLFPEYILSLIYLGLLYLRYPIFLIDVQRWATQGVFPYLDPTESTSDYLNSLMDVSFAYRKSYWFNIRKSPNFSILRMVTRRMIAFYKTRYQFDFPSHQRILIWNRIIEELNMPEKSIILFHHLFHIWNGYRMSDTDLFELSEGHDIQEYLLTKTIACVIVGLKLIYGLDGYERIDMNQGDNSLQLEDELPLQDWLKHLYKKSQTWSSVPELFEYDLLEDEKRKLFMEYWERYLTSDNQEKYLEVIYAFESLNNSNGPPNINSSSSSIQRNPGLSKLTPIYPTSSNNQDTLLHSNIIKYIKKQRGKDYVYYDSKRDKVGDYHPHYDLVLRFTSSLTGLSIPTLQREVEHLEKHLFHSF